MHHFKKWLQSKWLVDIQAKHGESTQKSTLDWLNRTSSLQSLNWSPSQTFYAVASKVDRGGPYKIRQDSPSLPVSKHAASIPVSGVDAKEQGDSLAYHA